MDHLKLHKAELEEETAQEQIHPGRHNTLSAPEDQPALIS